MKQISDLETLWTRQCILLRWSISELQWKIELWLLKTGGHFVLRAPRTLKVGGARAPRLRRPWLWPISRYCVFVRCSERSYDPSLTIVCLLDVQNVVMTHLAFMDLFSTFHLMIIILQVLNLFKHSVRMLANGSPNIVRMLQSSTAKREKWVNVWFQ